VTPDQIRLVEAVVADIGQHPEFAGRFYARLFEVEPRTAALFPDVTAQERKLADELAAMVSLLGDLPSLDARARELGTRHRGYGVRAGDYRLVREVMADTLRDVLGDGFGPEEAAAWDRATNLIAELMLTG
jgi:hemoglobin-like flavoprotein